MRECTYTRVLQNKRKLGHSIGGLGIYLGARKCQYILDKTVSSAVAIAVVSQTDGALCNE